MKYFKLIVLSVLFFVFSPLISNAQSSYGYLQFKISDNTLEHEQAPVIEWTNISADYYVLSANCASGININNSTTLPDLCTTNRKYYPNLSSSISKISSLKFFNNSGVEGKVTLTLTAWKNGSVYYQQQTSLQATVAPKVIEQDDNTTSVGSCYSYPFWGIMKVGSTGEAVVKLQDILESKKYLVIPPGTPKGYFGVSTRDALAKYQKAVGIVPADGYFGPVTRAHFNSDKCQIVKYNSFVEPISTSAEVDVAEISKDNDWGVYTIKFDVTALEKDLWLLDWAGTVNQSVLFNILGSQSYTGTTTMSLVSSSATKWNNAWKIANGYTERFTLSVRLDPVGASTGNAYRVELKSLSLMDTSVGRGTTTYAIPNSPEFETDPIFID